MISFTNEIETAVLAWASLSRAAPEQRDQHRAILNHAVHHLGSRKPIDGMPLQGDAIEACAARITAALDRLQRITADPTTKPSAIQTVVDELRMDLADWLESLKETDVCI